MRRWLVRPTAYGDSGREQWSLNYQWKRAAMLARAALDGVALAEFANYQPQTRRGLWVGSYNVPHATMELGRVMHGPPRVTFLLDVLKMARDPGAESRSTVEWYTREMERVFTEKRALEVDRIAATHDFLARLHADDLSFADLCEQMNYYAAGDQDYRATWAQHYRELAALDQLFIAV